MVIRVYDVRERKPGEMVMGTTIANKEAWVSAALARYERPLLRYAAGITHDLECARDVVQDTFLKLCEADPARVDDHLAAWLYTVCRNRALSVRKKEARMSPLDDQSPGTAPPPSAAAEQNEARAQVRAVLNTLPENTQEAFRLKFRDGLTYRQIGEVMGISLGSVSNLITGALNAVRRELRPELPPAREAQS